MRHANARSVWTRFSCVSLFALAVWSREWIGWYSLIPVVAVVAWTWLNPRLFGVPTSTKNWASKSVFGERIWSERRDVEVPDQSAAQPPRRRTQRKSSGLTSLAVSDAAM